MTGHLAFGQDPMGYRDLARSYLQKKGHEYGLHSGFIDLRVTSDRLGIKVGNLHQHTDDENSVDFVWALRGRACYR